MRVDEDGRSSLGCPPRNSKHFARDRELRRMYADAGMGRPRVCVAACRRARRGPRSGYGYEFETLRNGALLVVGCGLWWVHICSC